MDLTKQKCQPCEGGVAPMNKALAQEHLAKIESAWKVSNDYTRIHRHYDFKDFNESMHFINTIAAIAEDEGHHPDMNISYNKVDLELTTHAIAGLSINDFIVAAKIDAIKKE